jgi:hypothetical protein
MKLKRAILASVRLVNLFRSSSSHSRVATKLHADQAKRRMPINENADADQEERRDADQFSPGRRNR